MTQRPRNLNPGRSALDLFGAELRHWRMKRELSQAGLAELAHFSADLICKVEKAIRWPHRELTEACDAALDTGGALARMWPWVETEHQKALEQADQANHADIEPVEPDFGPRGTDKARPSGSKSAFLSHTGRGTRANTRTRYRDTRRRPTTPGTPARPGRSSGQGWPSRSPWPSWPSWPAGGPLSLEEQLFMAAHESAEFSDHPSNVGPASIDQLRSDITRLSRSFANAPRLSVFAQTRWLRDRTFQLLDGRQRISQSRDLYFLAGATCGMLADITEDLGYMDAAMAHTRTGLLCAKEAGHPGLAAWIRCKQSTVAYYDGRPAHAAEFA
ncbi:MAG TPA: helix-turn-helix transcriptional regulator, partial [Mycobacteriales bacterium]